MKPQLIVFLVLNSSFFSAFAGSATWKLNPADGNWNNAANWEEGVVPNGPGDIATFAASSQASITVSSNIEVGQIVFAAGASPFTITIPANTLTLSGVGVTNDSGQEQNFVLQANALAVIWLKNTATTGINAVYNCGGDAKVLFQNSSSAGESTFVVKGGVAANARGGTLSFFDNSRAAAATITAEGGAVANALGGLVTMGYINTPGPSAGNATMIANGGTVAGAHGGTLFFDIIRASEPTLIANGGVNGAEGGGIDLNDQITGNLAHVEVYGNGLLDISASFDTTIGSLAGDGMVDLGDFTLTVGGNNQSTIFSGLIEQISTEGGSADIDKVGTGTLRLSGNNTFKGGVTISEGTLKVTNSTGSATGPGVVSVAGGTLAGKGIIGGQTLIGSTSGTGGTLQPAKGATNPTTLSIQNVLVFESDGSYTWKLNTKKAQADQVITNGVVILSGAQFDFNTVGNKKLTTGTVFTAISNTGRFQSPAPSPTSLMARL